MMKGDYNHDINNITRCNRPRISYTPMKGREPEWPNPQIECRKWSKKLKNGLKTKHPTLPNHSIFQKCEISVAHEMF